MPNLEALQVFATAASCGSFSATARRLGKSQSTISACIANLEIDLGVTLFDRQSKFPTLTRAGRQLLAQAEQVLMANDRLLRTAAGLQAGHEPRLSVAMSDTWQPDRLEAVEQHFARQYPEIELECLIAECEDLIRLVDSGRAHLGFVERQAAYPVGMVSQPLPTPNEMALYLAQSHPLAQSGIQSSAQLATIRALRLSTIHGDRPGPSGGHCWSAPSYLMLLEMTQAGLGWAELPCWLVRRYGAGLVPLPLPGWPRQVTVEAIWSRERPLGPAGTWLLSAILQAATPASPE
ncbi:LysR family transcriptional regulator [Paludibacterium sp. THUN1379]|uniref:LysR family transcriptional regulator n=1 Tax=Paludibacterium sp. THUN1379 TaxID=3112107 RepID=UPI00308F1DE9|nr:LysR family transcriptional regulator [Paludibacterium sp. THUN1379]